MKKIGLLILTLLLSALQTEAAVVVVQPGVTFSAQQPIQAVVIDSSGNPINQTFYYNSSLGGVDITGSWVGPNTSIYFPDYGTRYIWYNGYWVDQGGYYWNDGRRFYVNHPHWNDYWGGYWHGHGGWHDGWHRGWHDGWHGGGWHGHDGWHGGGWHGHDGWHGGGWHGHDGWHGGGWHGGHGGWHGGDHGGGHEHHGGSGGHGGGGGHHR